MGKAKRKMRPQPPWCGRLTMIIAGSAKTGIIAADVNC